MDTDRNLLFGVLALQADLLDAARFAEACTAWSARKGTSLAELLVERGWLTPEDRRSVEQFLERKLKKHGGDVHAGLAEVMSDPVRQTLTNVADPVLQRTLNTVKYLENPTRPQATVEYHPAGRDRYTLTRPHARGGIGQVWIARDGDLGREVALKELLGERADHPAVVARFVEEAQITGQLQHPNIVPVYELVRPADPGKGPFYTMRFVRGRTLAAAIKDRHQKRRVGADGPLALRELLGHFVAVCNAVAYAHSRGVLHRDLKPGNVVLGDFGEVIVLDWGLAKLKAAAESPASLSPVSVPAEASRGQTIQGQVIGTPSYMPPEQAEGRLDLIDERSDVYGLGAMLYDILTGEPPFDGPDTGSILAGVIGRDPEAVRRKVPRTPAALEAVCLKALAKRPRDRYASVGELSRDVERWLGDEPVSAYRDRLTTRAARWVRRHRTSAAVSVTGLVVVAVALTVATFLLGAKNEQLARANADERDARERERSAREQAQGNFGLAKDAVDKYLGAVTEDADLKKSDFNKLRRKLLETALPFYETIARGKGDDPALEAERGGAYFRLAELRNDMGDPKAGLAADEQARDIFAALAERYPEQQNYRHRLGRTLNSLAIARSGLGQTAAAADAMRQSAAVWRQLVEAAPDNTDYRERWANSQNNLGILLHNMGKFAEAEDAYRQALAVREKLVEDAPTSEKTLRNLTLTLNSLNVLANDRGKPGEGEPYIRRVVTIRERLVAEHPDNATYLSDLATGYCNFALTSAGKSSHAEAAVQYRKAADAQKRVAERFPTVTIYRDTLALYLRNLGEQLNDLGKFAEARDVLLQGAAVEEKVLAEAPAVPLHRYKLGRIHAITADSLMNMGHFDEAEAELKKAVPLIEAACAAAPDESGWSGGLGATYTRYGVLFRDRGDPAAGLPWFAKAVDTLQASARKNPGLEDVRRWQIEAHAARAEALDRLGRHTEALPDWDRAIELAGAADGGVYRCYRLLSAGKPAEALAAAEALAGNADLSIDSLYALARVCALAAAGADPMQQDRCAALALALLRRCAAGGCAPAEWMRHDPAFTALRGRKDFQVLLAEFSAKSKAAAD